jgi:ABC-2 type transport system ATP-binding protein
LNALTAEHISKSFAGHQALKNVSFEIPAGSIFGLLGPNGAGKTTLIRIINQIIRQDEGSIFLFGEKLQAEHVIRIGYLPEERGLYKKMRVGDQLLYLAKLRGMTSSLAMDRLKYWFRRFEIKEWWGKKVEDLSKGMAQKVQFISTILHEPKLIILDEPFSGFDPVNAKLITEVILELRASGSTILFSTHRMETVESLCDHLVLINRSEKILEGSRRAIREMYRSGIFEIEHKGLLSVSSDNGFEVLGQGLTHDGLQSSVVRAPKEVSAGQLLRVLSANNEINAFREKIPSMGDIFISLVGADPDLGEKNLTHSDHE